MTSKSKKYFLTDDKGQKLTELDCHKANLGPDVLDIGSLYANTGMLTFDPGFNSTASCKSKKDLCIKGIKGKRV